MAIFRKVGDFEKAAILNWEISKSSVYKDNFSIQFGKMGKGYLLSSKNILASENWEEERNILIFPVLFNMQHGIELLLKAIHNTLMVLVYKSQKKQKDHMIHKIYKEVESMIEKYDYNALDVIKPVGEVINEIISKTDKMDFARYPRTIDRYSQFYLDGSENIEIDVVELERLVDVCMDALCRLNDHFTEELNNQEELAVLKKE